MKKHVQGFTLVELMVSLALGSFVLLATITATSGLLNGKHMATAKLENDIGSIALLLERDLQRSGYWGGAAAALTAGTASYDNPFSEISTPTPGCVKYSYDRDANGSVNLTGADERFAMALHNGVLYLRQGGTAYDCDVTTGQWEALSDPVNMKVTTFAVTVASVATPIKNTTRTLAARTVTYTLTGALAKTPTQTVQLSTTIKLPNDIVQ